MEIGNSEFSEKSTFRILHVGGSGEGNYTSIQQAINNASDGDTIFVYDDSSPYYENIVVNVSVNLIGEDKNTTVISGVNGTTVYITADGVNITGFTITGRNVSVAIRVVSNFSYISNNNIWANTSIYNASVYLSPGTHDNIITGNNCSYNYIDIDRSYNNTIANNDLRKGDFGIIIGQGVNNTILNNICSENEWYGIWLAGDANNNIIEGNICNFNNRSGIYFCCYSMRNILINNTCNGNSEHGIYLWYGDSDYNDIINNTCNDNGISGITINYAHHMYIEGNSCSGNYYGIRVYHSTFDNVVVNNTCTNNTHGIASTLYAYNNTFIGNNCSHNEYGMLISDSYDNMVKASTFFNNVYGMYVVNSSDENIFYHNNFIHNIQNAYDECNNTWHNEIKQEGNYWDDYNGSDDDNDGIGDTPYNISGGDNRDEYPLMQPWIEDYSPPIILTMDRNPKGIIEPGDWINITCEVADDFCINEVRINITDPKGMHENESMQMLRGDETNALYYYNTTYEHAGVYEFYIWANDSSMNWVKSETQTIFIFGTDVLPPGIRDVVIIPDEQTSGGYVNISCLAYDDIGLKQVRVNITYPNGSCINESMNFLHGYRWRAYFYYNNTYSMPGMYNVAIWAIDGNDNQAIATGYKFIII